MALAYTTSPAYHLIAEDDDGKAAAIFEEGHYMQVEVAAMTAASDQPELAREFLALHADRRLPGGDPDHELDVSGAHPRGRAARGLRRRCAVPEKPLLFSPEEAQAKRDAALAEWLAALSR